MTNLFPLVVVLAGSIALVKCHPVVLNPELVNYEILNDEDQSVLPRIIRAAPIELQVEGRLDFLNNSDELETSELDRTRRATGGRGGHRHVGGHSHRDHISRIDGGYAGYGNDRHRSHHRRHRRRDDDHIFH